MSTLDLTVITATTPERRELFDQAEASIYAQTLLPKRHRWRVDRDHEGPARTLNRLIESGIDTEWLFRLDDDDTLDPDHFEVLSHWLDDDADIVYTWCRVEGIDDPRRYQIRWQTLGWHELFARNWIPCSAAIRTSLFRELGGYCSRVDEEDWDFWKTALGAGARFRCVPAVTWTYRMNPEWEHRSGFERRVLARDGAPERVAEIEAELRATIK